MIFRTGLGQDSHRFLAEGAAKPCIIGGILFAEAPGFSADSDGDVVFHALCNAITSLSGVPILGGIAKELCLKDGITDSEAYVKEALKTLKGKIIHLAIALEGKRPYFQDKILEMREKIAKILGIKNDAVGITATSGDGLTEFGLGGGVQCLCILTIAQ